MPPQTNRKPATSRSLVWEALCNAERQPPDRRRAEALRSAARTCLAQEAQRLRGRTRRGTP